MLIVAVAVIAVIGIVALYSFTARAGDKAPAVGFRRAGLHAE